MIVTVFVVSVTVTVLLLVVDVVEPVLLLLDPLLEPVLLGEGGGEGGDGGGGGEPPLDPLEPVLLGDFGGRGIGRCTGTKAWAIRGSIATNATTTTNARLVSALSILVLVFLLPILMFGRLHQLGAT